jgi:eukaryotic-like serine/threonine-protein kinase
VKRWSELKEAFWAIADSEPAEQARRLGALGSTDPELHRHLEALLAADRRGESLLPMLQPEPALPPERPAHIGPYEIVGVLGAGGMGEVYRAHDSRLDREVAIKVLPAAVANDPERLARFEREARVLASLNHPHIAQVYGLEGSESTPALVMELVEGPTLAQLVSGNADSPMTLPRVLTIARQIADGLDAAHEKGIIHRDLKPGNIALTPGGDVKILDFGVAKTIDDAKAAVATDAGAMLGTPAYMSPEQARGLLIDKRTDIWAFGCVLYELLTGRRPFAGATASDSIAAVLEHDPDLTILPVETPPAVRSLVRHCLEKDPRRRLRDIADARLAIDDVSNQPADDRSGHVAAVVNPTSPRTSGRRRLLWMLAGLGLAAALAAVSVGKFARGSTENPAQKVIASVVLPGGMRLTGGDQFAEARFAVSPDGRRLVLVASDDSGQARLWVRDLASAAFQPLPGTESASYPFWSPDSTHIAFIAAGKLKTIAASGGTPVTICDGGFRTGTWSRDGFILFAPAGSSPLSLVPAAGGEPTPITTLDKAGGEVQHPTLRFCRTADVSCIPALVTEPAAHSILRASISVP